MLKKRGDSIPSKPFDENIAFVLFVTFLLISASGATPSVTDEVSNISQIPCHKIKGEVIKKEMQEEHYVLYIELEMDEELEGYIVKVSEITYEAYDIGDNYEQITCDVGWYNMFKDTIQEMLDAGLLEQF
tara:strand:+ start:37603 stop:37992 length:390 start_codon:yes stop_codon:yes gene_type:complete